MTTLHIIHWNDVYQIISKGSDHPLLQFSTILKKIQHADPNVLTFFSGDAFGGSKESSATKGRVMVDVLNELRPDVSVIGNHELDHGYKRMERLILDTRSGSPWLLSNIQDIDGNFPSSAPFKQYAVLRRPGIRIGVIGLIDQSTYNCSADKWEEASFDPADTSKKGLYLGDWKTVGMKLSQYLRTEAACDIVIALTHAALTTDIEMATYFNALSPEAQKETPVDGLDGVDLLLGGHDHFYYVSQGFPADSWDEKRIGASEREKDSDKLLILKSGTNFCDLSEFTLELTESKGANFKRRMVIGGITNGRHYETEHETTPEHVGKHMKQVVERAKGGEDVHIGYFTAEFDTSKTTLRTGESVAGNFIADIVRPYYDSKPGVGRTDGVIICAGSIRERSSPQGPRTRAAMMDIVPFSKNVVVLELTGKDIWDTLRHGLSKYPESAGRFPVISGLRVTWDSNRDKNDRVTGVWLLTDDEMFSMHEDAMIRLISPTTPNRVESIGTWIDPTTTGRTYKIKTLQYMVEKGDDYHLILAGKNSIVGKEAGVRLDSIVTDYLDANLRNIEDHLTVTWDSETESYIQRIPESGEWVMAHEDSEGKLNGVKPFSKLPTKKLSAGSELSIGEWADQKLPGKSRIPLYFLVKDGRLVNEALSEAESDAVEGQ